MRHPFGWCSDRKHGQCRRARISQFGSTKDTLRMCGCDADGCPCAVMNYHFPEEPEESGVQAEESAIQ